MKTIKERANSYIGHPFEVDESSAITMARVAYIQGATEQKAIDNEEQGKALLYAVHKTAERTKKEVIDKACEWIINTYLGDYVTDEYGNGGIGDNVKLAEDFRKAMED